MVVILEDRLNKEKLVKQIFKNTPVEHHPIIIDAMKYMEEEHMGQMRLSGEEFFYHPLNVAAIVAHLHLDVTSIIVALLHNTIKDKSKKEAAHKLKEISHFFSEEISMMIHTLETFSNGTRSDSDANAVTKFILGSSDDLRLVMIKLADRLDNARTVDALSKEKQKIVANNLINIYSPLCTYLNLYDIKKELEEIAFKILKPAQHKEVNDYVTKLDIYSKDNLEKIKDALVLHLDSVIKNPTIYGRLKGHYSIYSKLKEKGYKSVDQICDLLAFTVLVEDVDQCFAVTKKLLQTTDPDLKFYNDYITIPKKNGYRAIHIITQIPQVSGPIEIQIKTRKMHHVNTYGPASHIAYKLKKDHSITSSEHYWVKVLHKTIFQYHSSSKERFSVPVVSDIFKNRIYVFTPQDKLIELPIGSTPIDFAYKLHSNIGNSTIGCKVNGKKQKLDCELHHGDRIELLLDQKQTVPHREWLHFVRTRKAREAIENEYRKIIMSGDEDFIHTI